MGIVTDAFGKLFDYVGGLFYSGLEWAGDFFTQLLNGIFEFIKILVNPIFILIDFVFYFIYQLGNVLFLLFMVFVKIGKLILYIISGIFKTIVGFNFNPGISPDAGSWGAIMGNISQNGLVFFQVEIIAYILMFLVWFSTAFLALRILSSIRNGG